MWDISLTVQEPGVSTILGLPAQYRTTMIIIGFKTHPEPVKSAKTILYRLTLKLGKH